MNDSFVQKSRGGSGTFQSMPTKAMPSPLYLPTAHPLIIKIPSDSKRKDFCKKIENLLNRHSISTQRLVSKKENVDILLKAEFNSVEQATKHTEMVIKVAMRDGYDVTT